MDKDRLITRTNFEEQIFEQVAHYSQLDPSIVEGIQRCVPGSGMRTTDEDTLNHIQGDIVHVYQDDKTKEVFAFSSTLFGSPNEIFGSAEFSDTPGCYLAGATISKEKQGTGFYKIMNKRRIAIALERGANLIFTRTQNPRVQAGIYSVLREFKEQGTIDGYDFERVLVPGCYGHMLTEEKPYSDTVSYDELDYSKGDAYVLLFTLANSHV